MSRERELVGPDRPAAIDIPTLETERLRLRGWRESDLDAYAAMCADEEFMRYLGDRHPMSRTEAWRHMAMMLGHWALRGYGLWAVEERARPGVVIGRVGCHYPAGWPDFEVGWAIARPLWGRGYATEAASAAMRYAFETLDRDLVVSCIAPANTPSVRVAERLGESLRGESEILGHPVLLYGIDRATWQARS